MGSIERDHLFATNKLDYVRGIRPNVACILCSVIEQHPEVTNLEVTRDEYFVVSVNLYPYNPGHLMIFPLRHVIWPYELTETEALHLHQLQTSCIEAIRQLYPASGFNIGYNLGATGGGSIEHLHLHIVPRFRNEHGFMATVAGVQMMAEDPQEMCHRFRKLFESRKTA